MDQKQKLWLKETLILSVSALWDSKTVFETYPVGSQLDTKSKSISNVRIEGNIENKSYCTIWVDPISSTQYDCDIKANQSCVDDKSST